MLRSAQLRQRLAVMLAASGAVLMFLAPETWAGAVLLSMGIAIELTGIALKRKGQSK